MSNHRSSMPEPIKLPEPVKTKSFRILVDDSMFSTRPSILMMDPWQRRRRPLPPLTPAQKAAKAESDRLLHLRINLRMIVTNIHEDVFFQGWDDHHERNWTFKEDNEKESKTYQFGRLWAAAGGPRTLFDHENSDSITFPAFNVDALGFWYENAGAVWPKDRF